MTVALLLAQHNAAAPIPGPPRSTPVVARWYFVDCSAASNGDGSRSAPWNSVGAVNAHGAFTPGERILLKRGTTCAGRLTPAGSGSNGRPIVLGAYGTGLAPVVNGGGSADQTGTVQLTDVHDWTVQDLTVTNFAEGGPDNTMRAGIMAVNDGVGRLSDIVIRHNTVQNVTSDPGSYSADPHSFGGIVVLVRANQQTAANSYDNVVVDDNAVDHVGRTGIVVWSNAWPSTPVTNVSVTRNSVRYAEGDSIILLGVDGGEIDHNVSEHGGYLPQCPKCTFTAYNSANAGIWPVESTNIAIRWNEVSGEGDAGGDGEGFDIDETTTRVVVEHNFAHDNAGGGVLICGAAEADIRYNVLQNDGGGEITFSCPTQRRGVRIFNNDIYIPAGSQTQIVRHTNTSGTSPILFANNIIVNLGSGGYDWPSPVTARSNLYYGTQTATQAPDATGLQADPELVQPGTGGIGIDSASGYQLQPGSPAIGSGISITSSAVTDYAGMRLDAASPSRGAFSAPGAGAWRPDAGTVSATVSGPDVALKWPPPTSDGGYQVFRSAGTSGTFVPITGLLVGASFVDRDLPPGEYRYRVEVQLRSGVAAVVGSASAAVR